MGQFLRPARIKTQVRLQEMSHILILNHIRVSCIALMFSKECIHASPYPLSGNTIF